jgi:hypothetical protein
MSSAMDLVVLNGPREADVVQLKPGEPLRLGRSIKGFQLIDPLVSLTHAEIAWEGDRYWIEDLGSATGTFVNDVRLTDKPVVLVPGMRIRLGETVIEVKLRPKSTLLRVVGGVAAAFLLVVAIDSYRRSITVEYAPKVVWYKPVQQGAGIVSDTIEVPRSFIRRSGVDHRGLKLDDVTDYDEDGVDELWLSWDDGRRVVTFDGEGDWTTIADLPQGCTQRSRTLAEGLPAECYMAADQLRTELPEICQSGTSAGGFPDLDCSGMTWRYTGGTYRVVGLDGVVAWMPPTEEVEDPKRSTKKVKVFFRKRIEGPDVPYLFTLSRPGQLAGFLHERGVDEPIHYLVCEESIPGVKPQVLTQRGEIVQLTLGCLGNVDLVGTSRSTEFGTFTPSMMAFTGNGYQALMRDVKIYLSGDESGLLLGRKEQRIVAGVAKPPERRQGAIRLVFEGPEHLVDPVAQEAEVVSAGRLLASEFAPPVPPLAYTRLISGRGQVDLDGCSELDVAMADWHCLSAKGCSVGSTKFMEIRNIGCGATTKSVIIPYKDDGGVHPYKDDHISGKIFFDAYSSGGQLDVLRVRLAYREASAEEGKAQDGAAAAQPAEVPEATEPAVAEEPPPVEEAPAGEAPAAP